MARTARSSRTSITRIPEKGVTDRAALDALLDEVYLGHIGLVRDGAPVVIPTAVVRDGDRVLVHGSTGSGWMRGLASGAPACVTVTALDAVVVARSTFESSFHYRSAVLLGAFTRLDGDDKARALDAVAERLIPGRVAEVRASTPRELAATMVLAMPIDEWSLKVSADWPEDPAADVAGDAWAGVLPLTRPTVREALAAPDLRAGIPLPPSVRGLLGSD
jgi:uncharacterized protein